MIKKLMKYLAFTESVTMNTDGTKENIIGKLGKLVSEGQMFQGKVDGASFKIWRRLKFREDAVTTIVEGHVEGLGEGRHSGQLSVLRIRLRMHAAQYIALSLFYLMMGLNLACLFETGALNYSVFYFFVFFMFIYILWIAQYTAEMREVRIYIAKYLGIKF